MRFVKVIFSTVIVLLGIVFIIENLEVLKHTVRLKLDLYFVTFQTPDVYLWVLVLFSFFLGVFTTCLIRHLRALSAAPDHPPAPA